MGLCVQGLGGRCSVPGASGMVALRQPSPCLGCAQTQGFGPVRRCGHVADQIAHPPEVSGVGAQDADLGAHQPGFRCVLGLLIRCSQSRG